MLLLFSPSFITGTVLVLASAGLATAQYNYWPLNSGNRWVFRNTATLQPVVMRSGVATLFNCQSATPLTIYKTDPSNYWAPTNQANLHWFIRTEPDGTIWAPGWYNADLAGGLTNPETTTVVPKIGESRKPYILIKNSATQTNESLILTKYISTPPQNGQPDLRPFTCVSDPGTGADHTWTVTYSNESLSTPGYFGPVVKATYDELGPIGQFKEEWYFANGIGPVKIHTIKQESIDINITLELVTYTPGATAGPEVTLRDLLAARTGAVGGLTFNQWNSAFVSSTGRSAPGPSDVCLNPLNTWMAMTLDSYLSYLENWGTTCSTIPWDALNMSTSMKRWDEWGSAYLSAAQSKTGYPMSPSIGSPDPGTRCAPMVSYVTNLGRGSLATAYPNRWIMYTQRQWGYLMKAGGCSVVSYFDKSAQSGSTGIYLPAGQSWSASNLTPGSWSVTGSGNGNGTMNYSLFTNDGLSRSSLANLTPPNLVLGVLQRKLSFAFSDVPTEAPFFDPAHIMYQRQITLGCTTAPTFCPQDKLSRGQMAVFIVRSIYARNGNPEAFTVSETPYFADVQPTYPFFRYIQEMKELGITLGCGDGTNYCPDVPIPNAQMLIFLGRAHRYIHNSGVVSIPTCPGDYPCISYFPDLQTSTTEEWKYIQYLTFKGVLNPLDHTPECAPGLVCPWVDVRRGQKAIFITRGILGEAY